MASVEMIINRFRHEKLQTRLEKQVMIDLLIDLKKSFSGESAQQFGQLYRGLALHALSTAKLNRRDRLSKIKGLRELSELSPDCEQLSWAIKEWQSSDDTLLADEARLAAVRAGSPQMFDFLRDLNKPAGDWLQIQLHYLLSVMDEASQPDLSKWLQGENPYALQLVLRLITLLHQPTELEKVVPLLHHQDDATKRATLRFLENFEAREACSTIFHLLDAQDEKLQIAAVNTIGKLGNHYHAELLRPLLKRDSYALREATQQAIISIEQQESTRLLAVSGPLNAKPKEA